MEPGGRVGEVIGQQVLAGFGAEVEHVVLYYHNCGND
jgi:hypothetical protein